MSSYSYSLLFGTFLYRLATLAAGYFILRLHLMIKYRRIATKKRASTDASTRATMAKLDGFKLAEAVEELLLQASISTIHEKLLLTNLVSCEDLVKFFTKAAYERCFSLNHIIEFFFDDALKLAKQRDSEFKLYQAAGKPLPPLFGIPVSVKDSLQVKGYDSSLGMASLCFQPQSEHGATVQLLLQAGAVPFVKTNVPQMLYLSETTNWIWGRALNPWDLS